MQLKSNQNGVTLIELTIVLTMVIILATISLTLYTSYTRKSRRIDAINSMLSISLAEERYRSNNSQYGTLAQVWGGVTTSSEGFYSLSITNVSATGYTITATATGNQTNDAESGTSCSTLTLASSSGTITKTPAVCWPK